MQKQKITIEVPTKTARAYEQASETDRLRVERALVFALQPSEEASTELQQILNRIGTNAQERGLTDEKLNELLNDDE